MGRPAGVGGYEPGARLAPVEKTPRLLMFVYIMWVFVWYDPDWYLAAHGVGTIVVQFYAFLFIPVCILLMKHLRRDAVFWPYLLMIGIFLVWMPFVINRGYHLNLFPKVLQYSLLTALTVSVLKTPKQVVTLLKLFLFQFIWFGFQGIPGAEVAWHQNLGNTDSFGPFMTIGLAYAYYLAMGTKIKKYRNLAMLVCLLGVAGTIMSFARGAIIGLCVVFAALAVRSEKKFVFLGVGGLLAMVALVSIMIIFPGGEFWNEMASITDEGVSSGTGEQRWVLWKTAWDLFLEYPILGVGPGNFGPNAAELLTERGVTDMGGGFNTPAMMYGITLHNDYVQTMAEQGVVGLFALAAVFIHFFKCVRFLRTEAVQKLWASQTEGFIDSNNLALGLEAAMLAVMVSSVFYPQFYINHWMWSIMMLAFVTTAICRREMAAATHTQTSNSIRGLHRDRFGKNRHTS